MDGKITKEKIIDYNLKISQIVPSAHVDNHWVKLISPWYKKIVGTFIGKWCIFAPAKKLDRLWPKLAELINKNPEIFSIKIRTSKIDWHTFFASGQDIESTLDSINKAQEKEIKSNDHRVICIYVKDYRNKKAIIKVRDLIREAGVLSEIKFKTNSATKKGIYSGDEKEFLYTDSLKNPFK